MSNNLVVTKGQAANFNIALTRNGSPIDLTGCDLTFSAKYNQSDSESVILKDVGAGITVTDAAEGLATLSFLSGDTSSLDVAGELTLFWKLILSPISGPDEDVDDGTLVIAVDSTPTLYIGVEDVRNAGMTDETVYTDDAILSSIKLWQKFLERACRQWFYPIELELSIDGTDSDLLTFGVPIISVAEVRINNDTTALDPRFYRVYNSRIYPADRQNPRIQLVDNLFTERDIYTAPLRDGKMIFRKGRQNQYVRGTFGYIEPDGSPPDLIQRALLKLVVEKMAKPLYVAPGQMPPQPPPIVTGLVVEEWTDQHKIRYNSSGGDLKKRAPGLAGITDDPEILNIIKLYKAPLGIATTAGPSYR